jgi:hypothetical protein
MAIAAASTIALALALQGNSQASPVVPAKAPAVASSAKGPSVAPAISGRRLGFSPALRSKLSTKRRFDRAAFEGKLTGSATSPSLSVKGRSYRLVGNDAVQPTSAVPLATAMPAALVPFKSHIEGRQPYGREGTLIDRLASRHKFQTPVRDQGARGTCTAFAAMAGMEATFKRYGKTFDLSESHAYAHLLAATGRTCNPSEGIAQFWRIGDILTANAVCTENQFGYSGTVCPAFGIPDECSADAKYRFTSVQYFNTPKVPKGNALPFLYADNPNLLEAFLKTDADLIYFVAVAGTDWTDETRDTGTIDVQTDASGDPAYFYGAHAMLLVGFDREQGYFRFKNSWGTDTGHEGYLRLSYDYVETYGMGAFLIAGVAP